MNEKGGESKIANYAQWRRSADNGEVRRVTWVCGDQRVLVEEVVDHIRTTLAPSDLDYVLLHASCVGDRDIWAAAHQYPLECDGSRLTVVRDAERIRHWEPLAGWLAASRKLPTSYLLFVADDPDFPYTMDGRKKAGLKPHLEAIKQRGHIVRCAMPGEPDAIAWVRRRAALDDDRARHLLTRTGGNLALAGSVCTKLRLFTGLPNKNTIDALCNETPATSFVDALLMQRKRVALLAAERTRTDEYGAVLGLLAARVDLLATLWRGLRAGYPTREVQALPLFLVKQLQPAAKYYDPQRCAYYRRVLAVVEEAHRNGARDAVMEALVALW